MSPIFSPKLNLSKFRKILSFDTVCFFWWGLLRSIQTVEARKAGPLGPEPSAARLAPRALSTGGVDSLGSKKWDNCFVYRERELNRFQLKNLSLASNREDVWSTGVLAHQKES